MSTQVPFKRRSGSEDQAPPSKRSRRPEDRSTDHPTHPHSQKDQNADSDVQRPHSPRRDSHRHQTVHSPRRDGHKHQNPRFNRQRSHSPRRDGRSVADYRRRDDGSGSSRPSYPRHRSKSREREHDRGSHRSSNNDRDRNRDHLIRRSPKQEHKPIVKSPMDQSEEAHLETQAELLAAMNFTSFGSTKNKKQPGNSTNYGVATQSELRARQYMNRSGGFNRPLSPTYGNPSDDVDMKTVLTESTKPAMRSVNFKPGLPHRPPI